LKPTTTLVREGGRCVLAALFVAAVVAAIHAPVLGARALSFDDAEYVTHNPLVSTPGWSSAARFFTEVTRPSTFSGYYHPLSMTLLMAGYAAGGRSEDPRAFHVISLALHAANAALVMVLVFRLFGALAPAVLVALLFAAHPLTVEPVAWVGEQKALLAAFFALIALACHVEYARAGRGPWRLLVGISFLLALLAKPTAIMLPVLMLVVDAWPLRRFGRRAVLEKWPLFLLAAVSALVTLVSQQQVGGITHTQASELAAWPVRVLYVLGFYLGKLVWPFPLSSAYPQPEPLAFSNPAVAANAILVVALTAALVWLRRSVPAVTAAWAFLVLALAPTLTPVKYTWAIAFDHYLYLPVLGILLALGAWFTTLWNSPRGRTATTRAGLAVAILAVVAAEGAGARAAIATWADSMTHYRHMETVAPRSPAVHNQLGILHASAGAPDEALRHLRRAIELSPDYGGAHYNLGISLAATGALDEAIREFRTATELMPNDADAHFNLSTALRLARRPAEAVEPLRRAVALDPSHARAQALLGSTLAETGDFAAAARQLRIAIAQSPQDATLHYQLAAALTLAGDPPGEIAAALSGAIAARPGWVPPLNDLAWLRATSADSAQRDAAEALRLARRVIELAGSNDPRLLDTLAAAQAAAGDYRAAAATARDALGRAESGGARELARDLRIRLALYERNTPYRATRPSGP